MVAVVIGVLGVGSYAIAGGGSKSFKGSPLNGYEENPDISTVGTGSFEARLSKDGTSLHYKLSYSGLEGNVQQAHVHFGKRAINGGISFFLCSNLPNPPAGTPACPGTNSGTVEGDIEAADVIGPGATVGPPPTAGQGIEPGNLAGDPRGDAGRTCLRERSHDQVARRRDPRAAKRPELQARPRRPQEGGRQLGGEAGLEACDHVSA